MVKFVGSLRALIVLDGLSNFAEAISRGNLSMVFSLLTLQSHAEHVADVRGSHHLFNLFEIKNRVVIVTMDHLR